MTFLKSIIYKLLNKQICNIYNKRFDIYNDTPKGLFWNNKLSQDGEMLSNLRNNFFNKTLQEFKILLKRLEPNNIFDFFESISINFSQGWSEENTLLQSLEKNEQKDLKRKTTTEGPHKSDIKFLINTFLPDLMRKEAACLLCLKIDTSLIASDFLILPFVLTIISNGEIFINFDLLRFFIRFFSENLFIKNP